MAGNYYLGIIIAAGFKIKQLILQITYTGYPNTKIVYYSFHGKVNTYSVMVSAAYMLQKKAKRKPNKYLDLYSPPGS